LFDIFKDNGEYTGFLFQLSILFYFNCIYKMESPLFKNKKTVSLPIPIKYEKDNSLNNNSKNTSHTSMLEEVEEKQNFFDPTKPSPPNSWTSRLEKRIHNYYLEREKKE
jgi:hypothetical protein